jgi:hypothetical protein
MSTLGAVFVVAVTAVSRPAASSIVVFVFSGPMRAVYIFPALAPLLVPP